jgi:probable HAF family extracellular repeat protein
MRLARLCPILLLLLQAMLGYAGDRSLPNPVVHFVSYPGAQYSSLFGISNNRIGVGIYYDSTFEIHGYMLLNGRFTSIDDPKGAPGTTSANAVNSSGTIVGSYGDAAENSHAFSYSKGVFTDIGPSGVQSIAYGINDLGQTTGTFEDTDGNWNGWIFDGAEYKTVVVTGATNTVITGTNVHGIASVEWTDLAGHEESSVYNGTTFTTINVPGAVDSFASGIDAANDVIYAWDHTPGTDYGALRTGHTLKKFSVPGCVTSFGTGINDHHEVVGVCNTDTGFLGFYATY